MRGQASEKQKEGSRQKARKMMMMMSDKEGEKKRNNSREWILTKLWSGHN